MGFQEKQEMDILTAIKLSLESGQTGVSPGRLQKEFFPDIPASTFYKKIKEMVKEGKLTYTIPQRYHKQLVLGDIKKEPLKSKLSPHPLDSSIPSELLLKDLNEVIDCLEELGSLIQTVLIKLLDLSKDFNKYIQVKKILNDLSKIPKF